MRAGPAIPVVPPVSLQVLEVPKALPDLKRHKCHWVHVLRTKFHIVNSQTYASTWTNGCPTSRHNTNRFNSKLPQDFEFDEDQNFRQTCDEQKDGVRKTLHSFQAPNHGGTK